MRGNGVKGVECPGCGKVRPVRCRGLCKVCYRDPDTRERFARQWKPTPGILATEPTGEPTTPTMAPIGSPWKMRVMAARAAAGLGVFHRADNPTAFLMVSERFWRRVVRRWKKRACNITEVERDTKHRLPADENAMAQVGGDWRVRPAS